MSEQPSVSVVVLNWNGKKYLWKCLSSLLQQTYSNYEIVFLDNGSTDGSVDFVKKKFKHNSKVNIVVLNQNYGFAKGNNIGFKHTKSKYVIVLNNDTQVQPKFIEELVKVAESGEKIGSVGCKIMQYTGSVRYGPMFTNKGFIVPLFLGASTSFAKARLRRVCDKHHVNLANCACAVLYRKELLDKIGGFDEDFWSHWEDHDLGYRINLNGFKSVFTPETTVFHVGAGSETHSAERHTRIIRNMLFAYVKNYEIGNLAIRFPLMFSILLPLWHIGWIVYRLRFPAHDFDRRRGIYYLFSIIKAYLQFIAELKIFTMKRYEVQRLRKVSDKQIFVTTNSKLLV